VHPAIAVLELDSIALGIAAGDAMVKRAPVAVLYAGSVHPGKYVDLVGGEVADVEEALAAGRRVAHPALVDELLLPDVHPQVVRAVCGGRAPALGEALGVVETRTVAAVVGAADRGVKGAHVTVERIRLADGLGGKAYCLLSGRVADVEAAVELAVGGLSRPELLIQQAVIPQLHTEMRANLDAAAELVPRLGSHRGPP
jgi:microcompartment protein CcmL/EutN